MPDPESQNPAALPRLSARAKRGDLDSEFAQKYFTLLVGQYKTLREPVDDPAARAEAESIIKAHETSPAGVTWEEIYRLELAILKLEPFDELCRRAWILREEYEEVASADERVQYAASNPPKADPAAKDKEKELRADLVRLQVELNWAYTVLWVQESFRSSITKVMAWTALAVAIAFALTVISNSHVSTRHPDLFTLDSTLMILSVALAGTLGGAISTLRRIQTTRLSGNSDLNMIQLERGKSSIYCSPLLGAVFAVILCALFASSLLKGSLFPEFKDGGSLLFGCFALLCTEKAKLLVWSFIAGFAEKLVPDRLDQLSQRANAADEDRNP